MRTIRNLFAASVLVFAISLSTTAGDMHTGAPKPEPTPAPASAEVDTSTEANGNIHTGDTDEAAAGDAVVAGALSLLQGVLSLL